MCLRWGSKNNATTHLNTAINRCMWLHVAGQLAPVLLLLPPLRCLPSSCCLALMHPGSLPLWRQAAAAAGAHGAACHHCRNKLFCDAAGAVVCIQRHHSGLRAGRQLQRAARRRQPHQHRGDSEHKRELSAAVTRWEMRWPGRCTSLLRLPRTPELACSRKSTPLPTRLPALLTFSSSPGLRGRRTTRSSSTNRTAEALTTFMSTAKRSPDLLGTCGSRGGAAGQGAGAGSSWRLQERQGKQLEPAGDSGWRAASKGSNHPRDWQACGAGWQAGGFKRHPLGGTHRRGER